MSKLTKQQVEEIKQKLPSLRPYGRLTLLAKEYQCIIFNNTSYTVKTKYGMNK